MKRLIIILVLVLPHCQAAPEATDAKMHASKAGRDCDVLLIETDRILDAATVESLHYGTGRGGVHAFSRMRPFRGVAYRDRTGKIWTYGDVTSLAPCGERRNRLALLVGIDDYSASRLGARPYEEGQRDWPNLRGAVNDVQILRDMLRDFDVVTLTNQKATRHAILQALDDLTRKAAKDDIVFFYFAGHGSQVPNSLSTEADRLDESIVPADSRAGALDIRDKELRAVFNRILDRGARLTVMLDNCHSASGARNLPVRGIARDTRAVADPGTGGPAPEDRGALVITAVQDDEIAWETPGDDGKMHGAFSWAWIRAMRDAAKDEPAIDTFLRAHARLRGEKPFQTPAIAGNTNARRTPFLGDEPVSDRATIAVEKVRDDGTVVLQGGLAHGLRPGAELRTKDARLTVTAADLARSEARAEGVIRAGAIVQTRSGTGHWHELESGHPSPFQLALRRERDGFETTTGPVRGGEQYTLVLRGTAQSRRFVYAFVIDSRGKSALLYPPRGSVENRHAGPAVLAGSTFTVTPPYGVDTYFLLATDHALPNPWILGWDDVRATTLLTAGSWSLQKLSIESVP